MTIIVYKNKRKEEKQMTFKEKLVRLRKLKGLTQDEFAKAVGVSRQAVYKWESGQSYPEVSKLLEIKLLFGISIDDLLDDNYEVALPEKKKRKRSAKAEASAAEVSVIENVTHPAQEASEPVGEKETEAAQEPETVSEQDESKRRVGLFGRIFGRK